MDSTFGQPKAVPRIFGSWAKQYPNLVLLIVLSLIVMSVRLILLFHNAILVKANYPVMAFQLQLLQNITIQQSNVQYFVQLSDQQKSNI